MSAPEQPHGRETFKQAVRDASWPDSKPCPHCDGDGSIPDEDKRLVHCMGSFTGADWSETSVLDAIDRAEQIAWRPNAFGHDLAVLADGKVWRFQVPAPPSVERTGSAE